MGSPLGALSAGAALQHIGQHPPASLPPPALPTPDLRVPWTPLLTEQDVARGLAYWGSGRRLQAVAAKLLAGALLLCCRPGRLPCCRHAAHGTRDGGRRVT